MDRAIRDKYAALRDPFKEFVDSKCLSIKDPFKWIDQFAAVKELDIDVCIIAASYQKKAQIFGITCFISVFLLLFIGMFFVNSPFWIITVLFLSLFAGSGAAAFVFLIKVRRIKRQAISPVYSSDVFPLLLLLKEDFDTDKNAEIKIDLQDMKKEEYKTDEKPYRKGKERTYFKKWFLFSSMAPTGGNIQIDIADKVVTRNYTKRSASGKYKSKSKMKVTHYVTVRLFLPESIGCCDKESAVDTGIKIKYLNKENKTAVSVTNKILGNQSTSSLNTKKILPYTVMHTIASAIQCFS